MVSTVVSEVIAGFYLGLLAAFFPALIAFAIGLVFKYFTGITVPALAVVVLGGTLAGVSGGLMGLMSPEIGEGWIGITAFSIILMTCLWAHGQGDKMGDALPRNLTIQTFKENRLSTDLAGRIDSYGQIRVNVAGEVQDIEGYPQLPDELRQKIQTGSWKFPADLSLEELERRLETTLVSEHDIAEASVTIDRRGWAQIAAAPSTAGLSRRIPEGKRAVSIETVVPTGLYRGDEVTIRLPDREVTGPVVSAKTTESGAQTLEATVSVDEETAGKDTDETDESQDQDTDEDTDHSIDPVSVTTGGDGQVTVALPRGDARQVIESTFAPIIVHPRGKQREYEAVDMLEQYGNRFRKVVVRDGSSLEGITLGSAKIRDKYGVAVVSLERGTETFLVPRGRIRVQAGDELIVVGTQTDLSAFEGVVA